MVDMIESYDSTHKLLIKRIAEIKQRLSTERLRTMEREKLTARLELLEDEEIHVSSIIKVMQDR